MALTFSITAGAAHPDGRKYVLEVYSDANGEAYRCEYLAAVGADHTAIATARAALIEAQLADDELADAVSRQIMPPLRFLTGAQVLVKIREWYRDGEKDRVVRIARWIQARIQAGDVTATQVRNAFGLTTTQWNALSTKMLNLIAADDLIQAAKGE